MEINSNEDAKKLENKKIILFDSSSLISLAMNGLLPELIKLKEIFNGKFIIPEEVKKEIIEKPLKIKRFELEALNLNQLLDEKILELPESIGIKSEEISVKTKKLLDLANETFFEKGRDEIHLIDSGETACLVLSKMLSKKSIQNIILVDERTTRLLVEKPTNLKKLLQKKLHREVEIKKENLEEFKNIKIARSSELIYIAYKKGLVRIKNDRILDALLYSLKYKGCAISIEEIEILKKMGKNFQR